MSEYKGNNEVGYLRLPNHPGLGVAGCVDKQIRLSELVEDHNGPDVFLDYDEDGVLIGIEILYD